jgi:uncharacterized protein with gpF-like domain
MRRLLDQNPQRELRRQTRLLLVLERQYASRFAKEIGAEIAHTLTQLEAGKKPGGKRHYDSLVSIERQLAETAMAAFGGRILDQGKSAGLILEVKFNITTFFRDRAIAYVNQESIKKRITSIAEATRKQIVKALRIGVQGGLTKAEAIAKIRKAGPSISRARAKVIARTETHAAANAGANDAAVETGLRLKKEWISVNDGRTRSAHSSANGKVVGMDEGFIVNGEKLRFPGDPNGSAANVINCRCALGHVVIS